MDTHDTIRHLRRERENTKKKYKFNKINDVIGKKLKINK